MSTTINDLTSLSHLDIDHGLDKPSEAHIDNKADDVINHEALDSKYAHLGMIASVRVFKKNILICFLVLLGVIFDGKSNLQSALKLTTRFLSLCYRQFSGQRSVRPGIWHGRRRQRRDST
jgi:hypothetical protein